MEEQNVIYTKDGLVLVITCKVLGMDFKGDEAYLKIYDTNLKINRLLELKNTYFSYQNYIKDKN